MSITPLRCVSVRNWWRGFLRGLAVPVELFVPPRIGLPNHSDGRALREDWKNIGRDFRAAMRYERDSAGSR